MIVYALHCACGHEFDQWFDNMADYDARKAEGLTCPSCGGTEVSKAIMAPRVGKAKAEPAPMHPCNPGGCANSLCPMAQMAS
ncbi:DUF1178 family protein [Azospirillum thermophilum]|uniref:DUF1178 domain-containing protein n=1 Tax=Azospirillum thermophilum TaxID=2202148 RepID=A0A2S2CWI4_9PROT|nr:DUF1178 family protein [Azospirillum thermophilum]AWK88818.1 DUF1178 domain-containing protein [Azospirillum thermophilum]